MGPAREYFVLVYFSLRGCCGSEMFKLYISLWENVLVLELKLPFSMGMSKLLSFKWNLFLLSDVPLPVRMS